jgi:NADH dehydrogenase
VIIKVLQDPAGTTNRTYTIGGPAYYSFSQIIDVLLKTLNKQRIKAPVPTPLVGVGAAVMEAVLPNPPITKAAMTLFTFDNTTDLKSVERDFGFTPMSFAGYMKEHGV